MSFVFPTPQLQQVPNPLNIYYEVGEPSSPSLEPKIGSISVDSANVTAYMLMSKTGNVPDWRALVTASEPGDITEFAVLVGGPEDNILSITPDASTTKVLVSGGTSANPSWQNISGALTIGTFGSTPNSAGASLSGGTLTLQPASASFPGGVSTATQSFAGAKTFTTSASSPLVLITGSSSGVITIQGQAAAGTYNFNLPIDAGTSGQPLLSGGGSTSPMTFGTLGVAAGGTGATGFTAYAPICAGATSTTALQSAGGTATSGYVLTAQGIGAVPIWAAGSVAGLTVNVQTFTSSGTYTPTAGMKYCKIEGVGAGGGGGGASSGAGIALTGSVGGGGGSGEYGFIWASAATIGVSKAVTINAGGTAGAATANGGGGGTSVVDTILTLNGGSGGIGGSDTGAGGSICSAGGAGGTGGSGGVRVSGTYGGQGMFLFGTLTSAIGGPGAPSFYSGGGSATITSGASAGAGGSTNGNSNAGYGVGGSGGSNFSTTTSQPAAPTGAAGNSGIIIITEFIAT